ncbi:NAD-dependent epimerase/dehydratase family protein [Bradyrhizobium roseum]|uniref:NAD-dependent epimerase/dehydratase family protein n=1 Tax=Bradyrhizobium roseum TaxID=3056648 RepID=UPI00262981F4|nr:NAD(P)-dependent oxidoreductase [Bradyrhizobium roseus]WKA31101.1 NAD(P)-dependent oxidoreductase [Bradyrhizobium roseus]
MKVLVFGGAGFVGLNIAAALLVRGHSVTSFDRAGLPRGATNDFARYGDRLTAVQGDVRDSQAVQAAVTAGYDAIILGTAITAGPEREASDPETILQVNLLAQTPILMAAQKTGVKRIINLSSAAAYGASAFHHPLLDEETPCDPASLYAITKFASEKVAARLAGLWQREIVSVRLSAVFGPWERSNDVRDTPSPQAQILSAMQGGYQAILSRPGVRDWIYAADVADAVSLLIEAPKPEYQLYNISSGMEWSALQWGEELAALHPGLVCRLADAGEVATVDLHSAADRAPLSVARMADEFGWRARFGCADSAADLSAWWKRHREDT